MTCALCLQDTPLRNSHIYPEWIYKPVYDKKHRLEVLSVVPEEENQLLQKGMRERLLCDSCEQRISVWEGYASTVLVPPKELLAKKKGGETLSIENIDYKKLKLFELSILWRAAVSKLRFFEKCQLGPHAECLRRQLLLSEPSSPDLYGALMYCLNIGDRAEALQVISEPQPIRLERVKGYNLTFGGFAWLFVVSSTPSREPLRLGFLRPDGSRLVSVQDARDIQGYRDFAAEVQRLGRAPRGLPSS